MGPGVQVPGFQHAAGSRSGFSLVEVVTAMSILAMVLGSIFFATTGMQNLFIESQNLSQLSLRAQNAMDRVVEMASQAVTGDAMFSPLRPSTGVDSHCLRFRLMQSIDAATGNPIYDDISRVYVYGPDAGGPEPCSGLIIGRGSTLGEIYANAKGPDGTLGTSDDNTSVSTATGIPFDELLIPSSLAPSTGQMFTVNVSPAPIGRLVTFTLRINMLATNGNFVLPNDLVLTERVALRQ
jgi:prepilin-type N-terminal cleavage/methylation domain-containing protein